MKTWSDKRRQYCFQWFLDTDLKESISPRGEHWFPCLKSINYLWWEFECYYNQKNLMTFLFSFCCCFLFVSFKVLIIMDHFQSILWQKETPLQASCRLTDFDDVAENVGGVERRTVPTSSPELIFALLDAHGGACSDDVNKLLLLGAELSLSRFQIRRVVTLLCRVCYLTGVTWQAAGSTKHPEIPGISQKRTAI